jgi:membrane protein DedA with SNARE-associated domain
MSQPNSEYPPPPPNSTGGYNNQPPQSTRNTFSILAIIFGVFAIIFFPIIFGVAAIVLAVVARSKGERLSTIALIVSVLGTLAGFILGYAVASNSSGASATVLFHPWR